MTSFTFARRRPFVGEFIAGRLPRQTAEISGFVGHFNRVITGVYYIEGMRQGLGDDFQELRMPQVVSNLPLVQIRSSTHPSNSPRDHLPN